MHHDIKVLCLRTSVCFVENMTQTPIQKTSNSTNQEPNFKCTQTY